MSLPITPFQYLRRILSTYLYLYFFYCAAWLNVCVLCHPDPSPPARVALALCLDVAHPVAETTNQPGKTATIEMYAPSSYNDTVTGETLSSVSEKSESYSNEGSQPEYIVSMPPLFSPAIMFSVFFFLLFYMNMQFVNAIEYNGSKKLSACLAAAAAAATAEAVSKI